MKSNLRGPISVSLVIIQKDS